MTNNHYKNTKKNSKNKHSKDIKIFLMEKEKRDGKMAEKNIKIYLKQKKKKGIKRIFLKEKRRK